MADQDLGDGVGDGEGLGPGEAVSAECSEGYLMATSLDRTLDSMGQVLASLLAPDWERIRRWYIG